MTLTKPPSNPPQIFKVQYALTGNIDSILNIKSFAAIISLKDEQVWQDLYATFSNISFNESAEQTPSGLLYKQQLQLLFPGTSPLDQDTLASIENQPAVFLLHYQDGTVRVLGSLEEPARLNINFESGNRTGFSLTISNNSKQRSRFYYPDLASVP